MYIFITKNALALFLDLGRAQGKKEIVIWAVIHHGFLASKAAGISKFQKRQLGDRCKIINVWEFLAEKLGVVDGKFQHQKKDARLVAEVKRNPFHTAASLMTVVNFPGHEQTVRNCLRAANLSSRRDIPREVHKEEHIE